MLIFLIVVAFISLFAWAVDDSSSKIRDMKERALSIDLLDSKTEDAIHKLLRESQFKQAIKLASSINVQLQRCVAYKKILKRALEDGKYDDVRSLLGKLDKDDAQKILRGNNRDVRMTNRFIEYAYFSLHEINNSDVRKYWEYFLEEVFTHENARKRWVLEYEVNRVTSIVEPTKKWERVLQKDLHTLQAEKERITSNRNRVNDNGTEMILNQSSSKKVQKSRTVSKQADYSVEESTIFNESVDYSDFDDNDMVEL